MPRLAPIRSIDLIKKLDEGNRVVIAAHRKMTFVFRDGVCIHDAKNNKGHVAGYSQIRTFFDHLSYEALEALSVQNHHRTFGTEGPVIIAGADCRYFLP